MVGPKKHAPADDSSLPLGQVKQKPIRPRKNRVPKQDAFIGV